MLVWFYRCEAQRCPVRFRIASGICVAACIAGLLTWPLSVEAGDPGCQLTVLKIDQTSIILEMRVNHYTIEPVSVNGEQYQRILIDGASRTTLPGAPETPEYNALVGLPTTTGITLNVLEAEYETISKTWLNPTPYIVLDDSGLAVWEVSRSTQRCARNEAIYGHDSFWPAAPARLGKSGYIRDQAVAKIEFSPVQHNPVRHEIRIYRRLVVEIVWPPVKQPLMSNRQDSGPLLGGWLQNTLINPLPLATYATGAHVSGQRAVVAEEAEQAFHQAQITPALKILVRLDGIYRLTYNDLADAGFRPGSVDPRMLRITNGGTEIPMLVEGEGDGTFDGEDAVLFYGSAMNDAYTNTNVYWLSEEIDAGLRMERREARPAEGTTPAHFLEKCHAEEDTAYWQTMPSLTGEDRWFWEGRLSPNTKDMPAYRDYVVRLAVPSATASTARVRFRWKGYTALSHRTRILLNGQVVDERPWEGQIPLVQEATVPHSWLHQGDNVLRAETINSGGAVDQTLVNWIEIEYWRQYTAENDQLAFGAPGEGVHRYEVAGFASTPVVVFDVTDPARPVVVTGASVTENGEEVRIAFTDTSRIDSRYLALSTSQYLSPAGLILDQPSNWRSPAHGADYIIVTHEDFDENALVLADHRRTSGLRAVTVKVGDLYDEFSHGRFTPGAIRDFLRYAFENWAPPAPTYVLLLGDANQDYKDNLNNGTRNYVPSQNIESTLLGEVSSDNWFATVSGSDVLPDILVGRLPAQTAAEASDMVDKVIRYELSPPDSSWNTKMLFVADDDEPHFARTARQLADRLPYYYVADEVYAISYPPGDPRADIVHAINEGRPLVTYIGHGEYFAWGRWNQNQAFMFHASDSPDLTNRNRLPVVLVGNCLNGFFAGPSYNPSLAEVMVRRRDGGAVAMWAPTSLGYPSDHQVLLDAFYQAVFMYDQTALGAATTAAKLELFGQSSSAEELIQTYILFGDPATRLGMAPNYPYVQTTDPRQAADGVALDQTLQIAFSKPMDPDSVMLGGADLAGLWFASSWNADFTAVSYDHAAFKHGERYEVTIKGKDRSGHALAAGIVPSPWSFTVTSDNLPPSCSISVPGGNVTDMPANTILYVAFSEPVRPASVVFSLTPHATGELRWDDDGRHATFVSARLQSNQQYTFEIIAAKDLAGNSLDAAVQQTFVTGSSFPHYLPLVSM